MIPKTIHYCWFGGGRLPASVERYIESWKRFCPDYKIVRWDEGNFDVNSHRFTKEAHEKEAWAFVSDYARLKIIHENGGIYLDTDVELIKNLDKLLDEQCFLCISQERQMVATGLGFGAVKNHPLIKELMDEYNTLNFSPDMMSEIACPIITEKTLKRLGYQKGEEEFSFSNSKCRFFSPEYFDPIAPGRVENLLSSKTFSIHHYDATWTSRRNRVKRKIINSIGQDKVNRIKTMFRSSR